MAKLRINFCIKSNAINNKLFDGRGDEARTDAVRLLREGYSSRAFLDLVANLLEQSKPVKSGRGQKSRPPKRWLEIGKRYDQLTNARMTDLDAKMELAEEFKCAESTIGRAKKIYGEARDAAADIASEAYREIK